VNDEVPAQWGLLHHKNKQTNIAAALLRYQVFGNATVGCWESIDVSKDTGSISSGSSSLRRQDSLTLKMTTLLAQGRGATFHNTFIFDIYVAYNLSTFLT
jgi:hypothetical protein